MLINYSKDIGSNYKKKKKKNLIHIPMYLSSWITWSLNINYNVQYVSALKTYFFSHYFAY